MNGFTHIIQQYFHRIQVHLSDPELWIGLTLIVVKILFIIIMAIIISKICNKMVQRLLIDRERYPLKYDIRRARMIAKLIRNMASFTIKFLAIMFILQQLSFQLIPLLAGAGVVGLAIGFGAQSLVRDIISGFFIIFEDQFAEGDVIQTGEFKGTVIELGIRITKIKNWTGELFIIPNGLIGEVTNFSINNSIAVVDVSIAYEADVEKAVEIIKSTVIDIFEKEENIVSEPEVLGVQKLGASEVVLRVTAECQPNTHFAVARLFNVAIKKALDQNGIEIPYPRLVTFQRTEAKAE